MEAIGIVLIVTSLPLLFRWVPPNRLYGFRVAPTLRDRTLWYDVNALSARHMLLLGISLVVLEFVRPAEVRTPVLRIVAPVVFFGIITADWRTACRWERERRTRVRIVRHADPVVLEDLPKGSPS